jgi:hypothetical protein
MHRPFWEEKKLKGTSLRQTFLADGPGKFDAYAGAMGGVLIRDGDNYPCSGPQLTHISQIQSQDMDAIGWFQC